MSSEAKLKNVMLDCAFLSDVCQLAYGGVHGSALTEMRLKPIIAELRSYSPLLPFCLLEVNRSRRPVVLLVKPSPFFCLLKAEVNEQTS